MTTIADMDMTLMMNNNKWDDKMMEGGMFRNELPKLDLKNTSDPVWFFNIPANDFVILVNITNGFLEKECNYIVRAPSQEELLKRKDKLWRYIRTQWKEDARDIWKENRQEIDDGMSFTESMEYSDFMSTMYIHTKEIKL